MITQHDATGDGLLQALGVGLRMLRQRVGPLAPSSETGYGPSVVPDGLDVVVVVRDDEREAVVHAGLGDVERARRLAVAAELVLVARRERDERADRDRQRRHDDHRQHERLPDTPVS